MRYDKERRKENWQVCSTPVQSCMQPTVQSFAQSSRAVSKEEKICANAETDLQKGKGLKEHYNRRNHRVGRAR